MRSFLPPASASDPSCLRHAPSAPSPRLRLVVFPHAGGSASMFRHWAPQLPAYVAVVAVQPPGRETRSHEPAGSDLAARADEVYAALALLPPLPLVAFGHSLGGWVAFEVARRLGAQGWEPAHLVVSGARAPQDPSSRPPISHLPDAEFLAALVALGGVPEELLAHQDYLSAILPMLRADARMAEQYRDAGASPLTCPITVFGSAEDSIAPPASQLGWREHTTGPVERISFPGDHFFVVHHQDRVLSALSGLLSDTASADARPKARTS